MREILGSQKYTELNETSRLRETERESEGERRESERER